MSQIIGPGNHAIIANQAAIHAVLRAHQEGTYTTQQNLLRQMMNRQLLTQLVQGVVEAAPAREDVEKLSTIIQEAQESSLELERIEQRIRKETPFVFLLRLLPENKDRAYQFIGIVASVISAIVAILALVQNDDPRSAAASD
jgi:hypothetical protein